MTTHLHIFASGQHTATSGDRLAFSETDLQATADAYSPAVHEAPLVVGHPRHDAPAYGWVKGLTLDGNGLMAEPQQLDAEFAELVRLGRFKKISASFYTPDSPNNPVPGVYYLRHVGFLGAQPPAVKGLKQAEFAEAELGVVEFSELNLQAGMWRRMRDWLLTQFGTDTADQVIPDWQIDALRESDDEVATAFAELQAANPEPDTTNPKPDTPNPKPEEPLMDNPESQALQDENAKLKAKLAALEAAEKQARATAINSEHAAFAEQLVSDARLSPKHKPQVVAILDRLAGVSDNQDFGEGEQKLPLTQVMRDLLSAAAPVVEFGEHATKDKATGMGDGLAEFADADPERLALHMRANELAQSKGITYEQAVRQLL